MFWFNRLFSKLMSLWILTAILLASCIPGGATPVDPCSAEFLILAINSANSTPATLDTISLSPGCTYELETEDNSIDGHNGLPSIVSPITIQGNGATIRRGLNAQKMALRLFHVSIGGSLTINNLALEDGLGMHPPDVTLGTLNYGGAIYNAGHVSISESMLRGNRAALRGGAIYNTDTGSLSIQNTTLDNNSVNINVIPGEKGGAVFNQGILSIFNSTLSNNLATESGGAIWNTLTGTLSIFNSTLSGNETQFLGGSAIMTSGNVVIEFSTIAYNIGGAPSAAIFSAADTLEIRNSIIANNNSTNCSYPLTSTLLEQNMDSDGSCNGFTITDNPLLDGLVNNGGLTETHALLAGSPALDAATGICPHDDQRGEPRPQGPACDLGSVELAALIPPTPTPPTATPDVMDASINGWVFIDENDNGVRDTAEESTGVSGAILTLKQGSCPGSTIVDTAESASPNGVYSFGGLSAGSYCILTSPIQQTLNPESQDVTIGVSETLNDVNFWYLPSPLPTATHTVIPPTPTITITPGRKEIITRTPTPTEIIENGAVNVFIWKDNNNDGDLDSGEDGYGGVKVFLGHGACDDRAMGHRMQTTDSNGFAWFNDVPPGTYCAYTDVVQDCRGESYSVPTVGSEFTIVIHPGDRIIINFGYAPLVC
ncbi:MAG: hypothetical protein JEZ06_09710 [Anaerolineaceae bacterium]|nr:hypothetical protein [Anaerolineaceae bacterium]